MFQKIYKKMYYFERPNNDIIKKNSWPFPEKQLHVLCKNCFNIHNNSKMYSAPNQHIGMISEA